MKQRTQGHRTLLRTTQIAIASAAFALLAACGGGGGSDNANSTPPGGVKLQVVSFGDSLSDVGTYSPNILPGFGGGKFTTNPGNIWVQNVAQYYGGTITPAYEGGFGLPLTATGGLGYAQGGADVSVAQGIGWAPGNAAATTVPVATQVSNYLGTYGSFNANQLVLIDGGANDIFQFSTPANLLAVGNAVTAAITGGLVPNTPAGQVQAIAGYMHSNNTQVFQSAVALATQIQTIVSKGATHVVLMNIPDIGQTPLGVTTNAQSPGAGALLSGISAAYNATVMQLIAPLVSSGVVIVADAFDWFDTTLLPNAAAEGFTVGNTGTACNVAQMGANAQAYATQNPQVLAATGLTAAQYGTQFESSLFCSPATLTVAGADQTYVFADSVHPTTHTHLLFAQLVEKQIAATGLGK